MLCASDRLYFPPYYSDFWMNSNGKRSVGKSDPCSDQFVSRLLLGYFPLIISAEKNSGLLPVFGAGRNTNDSLRHSSHRRRQERRVVTFGKRKIKRLKLECKCFLTLIK